ncbi:unnamed protein product [Sphagnum troendelagicum]|uniref:Uncharacterized protein n=1 Tax=Sphagnum troendelagicum TaxID=128251 RepID=A0ABP0UP89_9BRYO
MAGGSAAGRPMSLWLRRQLKKEGKKKKSNENPYASGGLETFAALLEELQAKRVAMVDKTAMSVSAVRSLSKSAQEWTASTLSRTVSRCRTELSAQTGATDAARIEPPEVASANTNGGNEGEEMDLQQDCAPSELSKATALDVHRRDDPDSRRTAVLAKERELTQLWKDVFSAMASYLRDSLHSSYLSAQAAAVPKRLDSFRSSAASFLQKKVQDEEQQDQKSQAESLETSSNIEQDQLQSASFVFPTLPYLSSPPSPILLPAAAAGIDLQTDMLSVSPATPSEDSVSSPSTNLRRKLSLKLKSRFVKSLHLSKVAPSDSTTPPLSSSPGSTLTLLSSSRNYKHRLASAGSPGTLTRSPTLSATVLDQMENSDSETTASSSRLMKSQLQDPALRPKRGNKRLSFSRNPKASSSESPNAIEETSEMGERESSKGRRSPAWRSGLDQTTKKNTPASEVQTFTTMACTLGLRNIKTSILQMVEEKREMKMMYSSSSVPVLEREEIWPLCILVALLFLLVGQIPAVLATSIFFLVISQIEKLRCCRGHGRGKQVVPYRANMEASRKLNSNSTPGSPVSSPHRGDINSRQYQKRIIMEGLLERNRRSSG